MLENTKALTITYLSVVSFGSLNGAENEILNVNNIKKVSEGIEQYPYGSSQWVRRALRNQIETFGWEPSESESPGPNKGAFTTQTDPEKYIDDDVFGFMSTSAATDKEKGSSKTRTSPLRVNALLSLSPYEGDLDYGTNFMGKSKGEHPNIFETEIHRGIYRGSILLELDRLGCGDGFGKELSAEERIERAKALIQSLKNLWSSGRQARFLSDISPKFVVAAVTNVKNPIFLESVQVKEGRKIDKELLDETVNDYSEEICDHVFGAKRQMFDDLPDNTISIGEAFKKMDSWIEMYYKGENS